MLQPAVNLSLRPVGFHDWQFLYDLLAERPEHANISHKQMPDIAAHVGFLRSNPYKAWYIIQLTDPHVKDWIGQKQVGAIYLSKQDEIGLAISKAHQKQGLGKAAVQELIRLHPMPRYLANIAPYNTPSQKLFTELGFNLIQYTYELSNGSQNP